MGNAATIYDESCLNSSEDRIGECSVYEEHLLTMRFLAQIAKVLEKSIYQNYDVPHLTEGSRLSWYQLLGHCIKHAGLSLPENDPFRENLITAGRAEKLIGQIENEFATVCHCLLLRPIQEIRLYQKTKIKPLYELFCQLQKKLKTEKQSEKIAEFKSTHRNLHDCVIDVYESLSKLKNKLPSILEFQLEMNHYSNSYLEYTLLEFNTNRDIKNYIIPLKLLEGELTDDIPDYRASLEGEVYHSDINYVNHRIRNRSYRGNRATGIPFERNTDKNGSPNEILQHQNRQSKSTESKNDTMKSNVVNDVQLDSNDKRSCVSIRPSLSQEKPAPEVQPRKRVLCGRKMPKESVEKPPGHNTDLDKADTNVDKADTNVDKDNSDLNKTGTGGDQDNADLNKDKQVVNSNYSQSIRNRRHREQSPTKPLKPKINGNNNYTHSMKTRSELIKKLLNMSNIISTVDQFPNREELSCGSKHGLDSKKKDVVLCHKCENRKVVKDDN